MENKAVEGLDLEDMMIDETLESEGVWFPFPGGARVKIARINNKQYKQVVRRKFKASKAVLENEDDVAAELSEELMIEVYAETIVKDWEGLRLKGKEVPFSKANALHILQTAKSFRERVKNYAEEEESYRLKREDDAVKS